MIKMEEYILDQNIQQIKIVTADPSALGLFGLAMVTLEASSQKLGWTEGVLLMIPWAIFLGATAQFIACIYDFKRNNVFGATAFGGYAMFWYAVALNWMISGGVFGAKVAAAADPRQLGFAFVGYLFFSLFMTVGAMEASRVLLIIFIFIDSLFIGLAFSTFGVAPEFFHALAGWSEYAIAIMAFYGSAASVLNSFFDRPLLPVGKPMGIFKSHH